MTADHGERSSRLVRLASLAVVTVSAVLSGGPASAQDADEEALAEKYAPVIVLVTQEEPCGPGEPYRPTDVDALLDNDTVALRGPWEQDDLVKIGPTGPDLAEGLPGYHLDFPGNPLKPGCSYEEWAAAATEGLPSTVYGRVATEEGRPDRVAMQYWIFYPFNDFNNLHEGDWEMIQLVFEAGDAAEAADLEPVQVGYSQHSAMELADWDDPKLELVDGTHPVVYVAAGSHANFYESALFLGRSSQEGFGCDDTLAPTEAIDTDVPVIPQDATTARDEFPWLAFDGRWGERRQSFFNGPRGPAANDRWIHPISFAEEKGRDYSFAVPAGGLFGTSATDVFCDAVAAGSEVLRRLVNNPAPVLIVLAVLVLLAAWSLRRTTWRPTAPLRVARRRAGGQVVTAAARMYAARWRLFVGIGLVIVPVALLVTGLQSLLVGTPVAGVPQGGEAGGWRVTVAAVAGFVVLVSGIAFVLGATIRALAEIDSGRGVDVRGACRLALANWRKTVLAFLVPAVAVALLSLTVVLLPVAVALGIAFALAVPVAELEGVPAMAALRQSARLVRHRVLRVAVLLLTSVLLAAAVGPLLGLLLILATGLPFPLVNVVAGITFTFLMPYVALTTAYVYWDVRVRAELDEPDGGPEILPAELTIPTDVRAAPHAVDPLTADDGGSGSARGRTTR